jgi:hypothetical protein
VIKTHKIGWNEGNEHVRLDGNAIASAGFIAGTHYFILKTLRVQGGVLMENNLELLGEATLSEEYVRGLLGEGYQRQKVLAQPDGTPIIDLVGDVLDGFTEVEEETHVDVEFELGRIVIRASEQS